MLQNSDISFKFADFPDYSVSINKKILLKKSKYFAKLFSFNKEHNSEIFVEEDPKLIKLMVDHFCNNKIDVQLSKDELFKLYDIFDYFNCEFDYGKFINMTVNIDKNTIKYICKDKTLRKKIKLFLSLSSKNLKIATFIKDRFVIIDCVNNTLLYSTKLHKFIKINKRNYRIIKLNNGFAFVDQTGKLLIHDLCGWKKHNFGYNYEDYEYYYNNINYNIIKKSDSVCFIDKRKKPNIFELNNTHNLLKYTTDWTKCTDEKYPADRRTFYYSTSQKIILFFDLVAHFQTLELIQFNYTTNIEKNNLVFKKVTNNDWQDLFSKNDEYFIQFIITGTEYCRGYLKYENSGLILVNCSKLIYTHFDTGLDNTYDQYFCEIVLSGNWTLLNYESYKRKTFYLNIKTLQLKRINKAIFPDACLSIDESKNITYTKTHKKLVYLIDKDENKLKYKLNFNLSYRINRLIYF